jgi:hypothetical protein
MQTEWIRDAQRGARGLLHRFGVREAAHIRVESFAAALGLELVEVPLDGAAAQLVRSGKRAMIMVSDRVTDRAARRFSVAHELGHFVLDHASRPASELCTPGTRTLVRRDARDYEAEANAFAAELLMPETLLRRTCEVSPVDLAVPRAIAEAYGVSILAGAIRFAELASERCAAVFSAAGRVKWVAPSATFFHEIARGRALDRATLAWDYFAGGTLAAEAQPVPADAWLDTSRTFDLVEHSVASHELRTVLSMLWIPA